LALSKIPRATTSPARPRRLRGAVGLAHDRRHTRRRDERIRASGGCASAPHAADA